MKLFHTFHATALRLSETREIQCLETETETSTEPSFFLPPSLINGGPQDGVGHLQGRAPQEPQLVVGPGPEAHPEVGPHDDDCVAPAG